LNKIDRANEKALDIINRGEPVLVDIKFAKDVLVGMEKNVIGHAGPPLEWEEMTGPLRNVIGHAGPPLEWEEMTGPLSLDSRKL